MNKDAMIDKMEEVLASLRTAHDRNDSTTLKTLVARVKAGTEMARMSFFQNEDAKKLIDDTKQCMDELERAILQGDRELTGRLIDQAGMLLENFKQTVA